MRIPSPPRPRGGAAPDPVGLRHAPRGPEAAAAAAGWVALVAAHHGRMEAEVTRTHSLAALAAEAGRICYRYARAEAQRRWDEREDPADDPPGPPSHFAAVVAARYAQLAAAAKAEENRQLDQLLASQQRRRQRQLAAPDA